MTTLPTKPVDPGRDWCVLLHKDDSRIAMPTADWPAYAKRVEWCRPYVTGVPELAALELAAYGVLADAAMALADAVDRAAATPWHVGMVRQAVGLGQVTERKTA